MGKAEEVTAVLVSQLGSMSFQHLGKVHDFKTALMRTLDFIILSRSPVPHQYQVLLQRKGILLPAISYQTQPYCIL